MKKIIFIMILLVVSINGQIVDNFKRNKLELDWYFRLRASNLFSNNSNRYINLEASCDIGKFFVDGFSGNVGLGYFMSIQEYYNQYSPYFRIGLKKYFNYDHTGNKGVVHSLGYNSLIWFLIPNMEGDRLDVDISQQLSYSIYFFLTDRIAPHISLSPSVSLWSSDDGFDPDLTLQLYFGFTYFLKSKERVWVKTE